MHPGPVNRGVELAHELADHRPSVILDQVRNGVALRMALLYLVAGRPRGESDPGETIRGSADGSGAGSRGSGGRS